MLINIYWKKHITLHVHFRFVYWLQFHEKFGPIVMNISRVMNDISTIAITYLIVGLGFSLGLTFLLNEGHFKESFGHETIKAGKSF